MSAPPRRLVKPSDAQVLDPEEVLPDLDTRVHIHDLVVHFYREVLFDDLLAPVFAEDAEVDWAAHIPKLIDYWCRVLLDQPGYDGYLLGAHQRVHEVRAFEPELFDRWYLLFVDSVDESWRGPIAAKAKVHAARMAAVLARRLIGLEWEVPRPSTERPGVYASDAQDQGGDPACWAHLFAEDLPEPLAPPLSSGG